MSRKKINPSAPKKTPPPEEAVDKAMEPETPICSISIGGLVGFLVAITHKDGGRETVARFRFPAKGGTVIVQMGMLEVMGLEQLCNVMKNSSAATIVHFPHIVSERKKEG